MFRPGKRYSLITMLDVLEHLERPIGALRHALELLTPDGLMVITVPALMALWTNHDVMNHHLTRYTKRSFRQVAHRAGFDIQRAVSISLDMPREVRGARLGERGTSPARTPQDPSGLGE